MKRLILAVISAALLTAAIAPTVFAAKPPSGDSNSSDAGNSTVDTSQVIHPHPHRN